MKTVEGRLGSLAKLYEKVAEEKREIKDWRGGWAFEFRDLNFQKFIWTKNGFSEIGEKKTC